VEFIDSTGIAALMKLRRDMTLNDRRLVLVAPSRTVRRALSFMRLEGFFDLAESLEEASKILETRAQEREQKVAIGSGGAFRALVWHGEITALNADLVWERTRSYMEEAARLSDASEGSDSIVIDLSVVRFIDSSGLGLMVRVRKFARQCELKLRFANLQPAVLNVVQIARLEEFLLDQKRETFSLLRRTPARTSEPEGQTAVADK
jgi:anti-anti-sigma factor